MRDALDALAERLKHHRWRKEKGLPLTNADADLLEEAERILGEAAREWSDGHCRVCPYG